MYRCASPTLGCGCHLSLVRESVVQSKLRNWVLWMQRLNINRKHLSIWEYAKNWCVFWMSIFGWNAGDVCNTIVQATQLRIRKVYDRSRVQETCFTGCHWRAHSYVRKQSKLRAWGPDGGRFLERNNQGVGYPVGRNWRDSNTAHIVGWVGSQQQFDTLGSARIRLWKTLKVILRPILKACMLELFINVDREVSLHNVRAKSLVNTWNMIHPRIRLSCESVTWSLRPSYLCVGGSLFLTQHLALH